MKMLFKEGNNGMQFDAKFDLLTYLPGPEFHHKVKPYQQALLPFVQRMEQLVAQNDPVGNHRAFKDYTTYCRWPIRQMEYSFFIRHLPEKSIGLALDAGAGVTPFPYLLAKKGWEAYATDIEADQISLLKAYGQQAYGSIVTHVVDDLRNMQFPDCHFSLVTCVSVLEHLAHVDVPIALSELIRITQPGSRIIITTDVYPVDHPYIPADHGAFTHLKIELIFACLAKACGVWGSFVKLLNRLGMLTMDELQKFWKAHWQPGFWEEPNRGYGAIGMVFDLPNSRSDCMKLIYHLKQISQYKGITSN